VRGSISLLETRTVYSPLEKSFITRDSHKDGDLELKISQLSSV